MTLVCPLHGKELTRLGSCVSCRKRVQGIPKPAQATVVAMDPEPAPVLVIESTPKKRGRPPKHDVAMTPAERKAASRRNQNAKQDDAERRKLVSELMQIYRRQQGDFVLDAKRPLAQDQKAAKRQQERL